MLVLGVSLTKYEGIIEQNGLFIDNFDHDDKCFCRSVNFFVPAEVWDDEQVDS